MVGKSFMRHDVDLDEEEGLASLKDSEQESLSSREIRELQEQEKKKEASPPRRKVTPTSTRKDKAP